MHVSARAESLSSEQFPVEALPGVLTRVGYYSDTLPQMVISIPKRLAGKLPCRDGERVHFPLEISGERYIAGLRTTFHSATVQICPDLTDEAGHSVRLADIIFRHGLNGCHFVNLSIFDTVLYCSKGSEEDIRHYQDMGWLSRQRKSRRALNYTC